MNSSCSNLPCYTIPHSELLCRWFILCGLVPTRRRGHVIRFHWVLGVVASIFAFLSAVPGSAQQIPENRYQDLRWRMIGPFRGGRTRAAAGVPNQPNLFYVGPVNGGVWSSDAYGRTWEPIFDNQP